ncbi:hypothetical protein N7497_008802 [Penicillium chrysogenum]|uniref:Uncharacterized protein n=1 Tax=Penicillium chrysogenum TaxID=5076 RepID=A0ABQ8WK37_PENCH|nr:hypothetical protein N7524_008263 [Penicillium chrysogenum]KAJ5270427.1 hypothetical protein N7505_006185 [Penicillium chrysogenum]KAJ6146820.1 hypothetical protein N7497_008802 [Penicillium chrysogenum]
MDAQCGVHGESPTGYPPKHDNELITELKDLSKIFMDIPRSRNIPSHTYTCCRSGYKLLCGAIPRFAWGMPVPRILSVRRLFPLMH